jgi:hypothetical protein
MQDDEGYQTIDVDGEKFQKAIVFFDVNFSIEEIQKANQAAKELGKNLIVLPKMAWSQRRKMAEMLREYDKMPDKIDKLEKALEKELDPTKKQSLQTELDLLKTKKQKYNKDIKATIEDPAYTLQNKNMPALIKQLEAQKLTIDSIIISGHSSGTTGDGEMEYWGDFNGDDTDLDRDKLIETLQASFDSPALKGLNHVYISACNAMTPYEAKIWMKGLPSLNSCTGYKGLAGRGYYPAVQATIKNDLVGSELFYQDLIVMDMKQRDDKLLDQIKDLHKEYPNSNPNLAIAVRNPDGSLIYAGRDPDGSIRGELNELAFEEEAEICKDQANKIINDFTPEFLEVKSQLTMYKMAWTTLALSGTHKNEEIKSIETVLNKSIKSFFDKVDSDPEYKKQYEHLLAYKSPYKTKWMTKNENYMPAAMEFLATKMHSTEFLESVMVETYKGSVGEAVLAKIQADINKYGVDASDAKTTELMHDLYKNDPNANKFLANLATQITAASRGRGGLKGVDEIFYKKEIDKLNDKFVSLNKKVMDQLTQACNSEEDFIKYYSDGKCQVKDPANFEGILTFKPLLDKMNLEKYDIENSKKGHKLTNRSDKEKFTNIEKKYLKVSPQRGKCNFTFKDNELPVISFKDIAQNGEYHIAYVGESGKDKKQLLAELQSMQDITSVSKKHDYFNSFLKSNNIFTKQVLNEEIKFSGNSTGTFFKHDFDQSKLDPSQAHFDGIDGGYDIKITKENADKFMILSSWGNNKKQINCKEGKILKDEVNPVRAKKIQDEKKRLALKAKEEQETLIEKNPNLAGLSNPESMIAFDSRSSKQEYYNGLTNGSTITQFHKENQELGDYMILDKKASQIEIHDNNGFLKRIIKVDLTADAGDALAGTSGVDGKENNTIGAGIFTTTRKGKTSADGSNDIVFIKGQSGSEVTTAIRSAETNPNCTNCIKVPQEYMKLVLSHTNAGNRLYVLPEDDKNYFKMKNNDINFTTTHSTKAEKGAFTATNYNYSPKNHAYYENESVLKGSFTYTDYISAAVEPSIIDGILLTNPLLLPIGIVKRSVATYKGEVKTIKLAAHPTAINFVSALDDEKKNLMEMYNLDNDEYNNLAQLSFGILGNESEFGMGNKYVVKENAQTGVTILKSLKGNNSTNSRGLTQIKEVPKKIIDEYGIKIDDLKSPRSAAIATMGVLAQKLQSLKRIEHLHSAITPENRMDYVLYLYYGNAKEIKQNTATPDLNNYVQNVKKYSENYLELYQTKEEVK